jgi:hypothetical protein
MGGRTGNKLCYTGLTRFQKMLCLLDILEQCLNCFDFREIEIAKRLHSKQASNRRVFHDWISFGRCEQLEQFSCFEMLFYISAGLLE